MRELGIRAISAVVFGSVLLGAYYLGGVPWFIVLALAAPGIINLLRRRRK